MNISREVDVMGCDYVISRKKMDEIWVRTLSGVFAILFAVTATYIGFPYFDVLGMVILVGLLREWSRLAIFSVFHPVCWVAVIQTFLSLYLVLPIWGHLGLISVSSLFCLYLLMRSYSVRRALLFLSGCLYICIPTFVFITLNHKGSDFRFFSLWIFCLIWVTDSGAYFMGRMLKGPKLAPRISPNKTWAGFFGGIFWAVALGIGLNQYLHVDSLLSIPFFFILWAVPIIAHLGDLLESYMKRYFGVKDAGNLIPGHGGLLDRLDSLLLVGMAIGVFVLFGWIR
jgi:phosphatidate cytidylyltransferase